MNEAIQMLFMTGAFSSSARAKQRSITHRSTPDSSTCVFSEEALTNGALNKYVATLPLTPGAPNSQEVLLHAQQILGECFNVSNSHKLMKIVFRKLFNSCSGELYGRLYINMCYCEPNCLQETAHRLRRLQTMKKILLDQAVTETQLAENQLVYQIFLGGDSRYCSMREVLMEYTCEYVEYIYCLAERQLRQIALNPQDRSLIARIDSGLRSICWANSIPLNFIIRNCETQCKLGHSLFVHWHCVKHSRSEPAK